MKFWIVPESDTAPARIVENDDGELVSCDDCPCGGCADTYTMVGDMTGLSSGWTATITKITLPGPCLETGTDIWTGIAVGTGGFAFLVSGHLITVHGDPSSPTSWQYKVYGTSTGCGIDMAGTITSGNSCPDGSYSGAGPSRASTATIS